MLRPAAVVCALWPFQSAERAIPPVVRSRHFRHRSRRLRRGRPPLLGCAEQCSRRCCRAFAIQRRAGIASGRWLTHQLVALSRFKQVLRDLLCRDFGASSQLDHSCATPWSTSSWYFFLSLRRQLITKTDPAAASDNRRRAGSEMSDKVAFDLRLDLDHDGVVFHLLRPEPCLRPPPSRLPVLLDQPSFCHISEP